MTESEIREHVSFFSAEGILSIKNDLVLFAGDEFDRIYFEVLLAPPSKTAVGVVPL